MKYEDDDDTNNSWRAKNSHKGLKTKRSQLVAFAFLSDHWIEVKESQILDEYQDFAGELKKRS